MKNDLERFIDAQEDLYETALIEIRKGKKESHWMWFIFPQIVGLGQSDVSKYYAIQDIEHATEFLNHTVLGKRLTAISKELLTHRGLRAEDVFGFPDNMKLKSCMTLFGQVEEADSVFEKVLNMWFGGDLDEKTLHNLRQ